MNNLQTLLVTQTGTYVSGEGNDEDEDPVKPPAGIFAKSELSAENWKPGDRRPFLFGRAVTPAGTLPTIGYDRKLDVAIDDEGRPIVATVFALSNAGSTALPYSG